MSMFSDMDITKEGPYFVRGGYRVRQDFIRDTVWPLAHMKWSGHDLPVEDEGKILVPTLDVTGEGVRGEDTRLRIRDEYIGIGCQLISRPQLTMLALQEGWVNERGGVNTDYAQFLRKEVL